MTQLLLNIKSIEYIETRLLTNITLIHGAGVMLNYWRNFQQLQLIGLGKLECNSKVENGSKLFTTTLSANLAERFDPRARALAFLVTCVDGSRFLVGTDERPYPIVNTSATMPDRPSDSSLHGITVEYVDTLGLLPVLD